LIVSRPVQFEIDRQKSKGSGRLANRARIAASQFGEVLEAADGYLAISDGRPVVRLLLKLEYKVDPDLADRLNYEERDDQLVGIAAAYVKNNTTADVRVITHDVGPRASAKTVGVMCEKIRKEWLLAPETNEDEKRFKAVQAELARYQKAEPAFELEPKDSSGTPKIFEATLIRFPALDDNQVLALMNRIKNNFPEVTDFGPQNAEAAKIDAVRKNRGVDLFSALNLYTREFVPASEADISKYKKTLYPGWLSESWDLLRNLHIYLQAKSGWPTLDIKLRNVGTRPAENALITISALGSFRIKPSSSLDGEKSNDVPQIKKPPKAPMGEWRDKFGFAMEAFSRANTGENISSLLRRNENLMNFRPQKRDDESFYFKPSKPTTIVEEFSLECVRWRHQLPAESFDTEIYIKLEDGEFKGAIDVTIHSSNMTSQFNKQMPFRIDVREGNTLEEANRLVEQLLKPNVYRLNTPDSDSPMVNK
jgi:hypothetical protein